jgi:hypothetical protein
MADTAIREVEIGRLWFKVTLGKVRVRPYLENKLKSKSTWSWLK